MEVSSEAYRAMIEFPPPRRMAAGEQIKAKVRLEVRHRLSPEMQALWRSWGNGEENMENFRQAMTQGIVDHMAGLGLFSNLVAPGLEPAGASPGTPAAGPFRRSFLEESSPAALSRAAGFSTGDADYLLTVDSEELRTENFGLKVAVVLTEVRSGATVAHYSRETKVEGGMFSYQKNMPAAMAKLLDEAGAELAQAFPQHLARQAQERRALLASLAQGGLSAELFELQPRKDFTVAEWTNHILSWKNLRLDEVLRTAKTTELRDTAGRIEQTILQATDESEKEKDLAQRALATGAKDEQSHLDLSRAYRLRIEVLKPILAAIREEVVNRSR